MNILQIGTADGDVDIREDELATVTDDELERMEISREDLHRCFEEGVELMQSVKPGARVRPVADQTRDGKWEVHRVWYSPLNDPLMQGPTKGTA
jgi:hypothetical protein